MFATFLGFATSAVGLYHVWHAYAHIHRAAQAFAIDRVQAFCIAATFNAIMALLWLLVTSRLLGF